MDVTGSAYSYDNEDTNVVARLDPTLSNGRLSLTSGRDTSMSVGRAPSLAASVVAEKTLRLLSEHFRINPGSLRTVIGKVGDLEADGAISPGERSLLDRLPSHGSPRANGAQNEGMLRQEMGRGMPIRDASIDPVTGELVDNTGFLRAEQYLLQDRGWGFDPKTGLWNPPAP